MADSVAIWEDLGWRVNVVRSLNVLARARLHAGEYRAARIQAEEVVSLAQHLEHNSRSQREV